MEDGTSKSVTHCRGTGYDNDPFQWDAREDCASPGPRPVVVDRASVEPQSWGQGCSAWPLVDLPDLSVKHEYVPAGAGEVLHVHGRARQFFFVLSGIAHVTVGDVTLEVGARRGVEVAPGAPHVVSAAVEGALELLVISTPSTDDDRRLLGATCESG